MPAALIWDFDGTIADTETVEYESVRGVFREHGADFPVDDWYAVVGTVQAPEWIPRLQALVGEALEPADLMAARARYKDRFLAALEPCAGVVSLLDEATAEGIPMGVCSNSPRRWVIGNLTRLGLLERFATVVSIDDVVHGKPHPEPYSTAARLLDAPPEQTVAIEDSESGAESAVAAGLVVVGVPGPLSANHDLSAADRVVGSLAGVTLDDLDELVRVRQRTARRRPA